MHLQRAGAGSLTPGTPRATLRAATNRLISWAMRNRRLHLLRTIHDGRAWMLLAAAIAAVLIAHAVT
jgi:hypothetical protein